MNKQSKTIPFKKNSLLFAPMEGVTDLGYRLAIMDLFPEWDYYSTDFLRLPTHGTFSNKKVIEHIGQEVLLDKNKLNRTCFQILANPQVDLETNIQSIIDIGITHLDLNLGCPSPKVNRHQGGAYLLSELALLKEMLCRIRKVFPYHFSVKIRVGFKDDSLFDEIVTLINECDVDSLTIHGRTREQLYKGIADWSYTKKAVSSSKIPIICNGDIWSLEDIDRAFKNTNCHSVMLGRGALKTPWIAGLYQEYCQGELINDSYLDQYRKNMIPDYFSVLEEKYLQLNKSHEFILGRFKQFCRYIFEDFDEGSIERDIHSRALKTQSLSLFTELISNL
ncbi:MAG: tRNA-dihydrouridine synthase family protein [Bacteriovoracaceae bacterium]|jgi:tRNA-dihydrouridine synthase B|nr:tRNA-dihydrouridine synthase family protein [Bacteriovoracaceae bacterium]